MRNSNRSPAAEFDLGTVDRTYIQYAPDRGGEVEMEAPLARAEFWAWPQYVNAGVRGPAPFELARGRVNATRIAEPVNSKPVQRRWAI
jgi:hypothetical protein